MTVDKVVKHLRQGDELIEGFIIAPFKRSRLSEFEGRNVKTLRYLGTIISESVDPSEEADWLKAKLQEWHNDAPMRHLESQQAACSTELDHVDECFAKARLRVRLNQLLKSSTKPGPYSIVSPKDSRRTFSWTSSLAETRNVEVVTVAKDTAEPKKGAAVSDSPSVDGSSKFTRKRKVEELEDSASECCPSSLSMSESTLEDHNSGIWDYYILDDVWKTPSADPQASVSLGALQAVLAQMGSTEFMKNTGEYPTKWRYLQLRMQDIELGGFFDSVYSEGRLSNLSLSAGRPIEDGMMPQGESGAFNDDFKDWVDDQNEMEEFDRDGGMYSGSSSAKSPSSSSLSSGRDYDAVSWSSSDSGSSYADRHLHL